MNIGEEEFAKVLELRNLSYIRQPKSDLLKPICYTPDFYVPEIDTYFEVKATGSSWCSNRHKVLVAQMLVNLEIVNPDGTPFKYEPNKAGNIADKVYKLYKENSQVRFDLEKFMNDCSLDAFSVAKIIGFKSIAQKFEKGYIRMKHLEKLRGEGYSIDTYINKRDLEVIGKLLDSKFLVKQAKSNVDNIASPNKVINVERGINKRNYTFPLYPSTKKIIEDLAKSKEVSQAEVLDKIIKEKYNRMYQYNVEA